MVRPFRLVAALAAAATTARALALSPLALTRSDGLQTTLTYPDSLPEPLALDKRTSLKLAFDIFERDGGKGTAPHQAAVSFVECVSPSARARWAGAWRHVCDC